MQKIQSLEQTAEFSMLEVIENLIFNLIPQISIELTV